MHRFLVLAVAALTLGPAAATAGAAEPGFAPPSTPGPRLSVPQATIESRLACSDGVTGASRAPVLLVQGTGATAKDNWSWTYQPALDRRDIPWCAIDLPDQATSDVQVNGEYVVGAIRAMHARAGRKISIIGHSQGGMVPRWALRFWPDTRAMVDDLIGFAPSNHGSTRASCSSDSPCSAATWQQRDEADFMRALNSAQETFAPISYTSVYTRTDETVQPNLDEETGSSSLRTGDGRRRNVATQDICPNATYEHLAIGTIDPVAHDLAMDALDHDGPADPDRISRLVCARDFHPGIDRTTFAQEASAAAISFQTYQPRKLPAEPRLACYTTASCARRADARPATTRRCASRRRFTVRLPRLRGARATVAGKAIRLRRRGRHLVGTVDLRGRKAGRVTLRVRGRDASGRRVVQTRRYHPCRR